MMGALKWIVDARDLQYKFNKIRYKACLRDIEKQFINGSKAWARKNRLDDIYEQKYYEGFNLGRERAMFKEELQDLEVVYKTALRNYAKEVEEILPTLLHYMDKFLTVHKQNEAIREKLDNLLEKTGRESQEEIDGGDDE
jgi:hypothetical protein